MKSYTLLLQWDPSYKSQCLKTHCVFSSGRANVNYVNNNLPNTLHLGIVVLVRTEHIKPRRCLGEKSTQTHCTQQTATATHFFTLSITVWLSDTVSCYPQLILYIFLLFSRINSHNYINCQSPLFFTETSIFILFYSTKPSII